MVMVTVTACVCPVAGSTPFKIKVEFPVRMVPDVSTVRVTEPVPPLTEVLLRLGDKPDATEFKLKFTVPVNPFSAITVTVSIAGVPAVTVCGFGSAEIVNSVLVGPGLVPPLTASRGEMTQPASATASSRTRQEPKGWFIQPRFPAKKCAGRYFGQNPGELLSKLSSLSWTLRNPC
jgi:hypothetical protein